jgi:hypothetical protein
MVGPGAAHGFLIFEVILFSLASLTHAGRLFTGFAHSREAIAEVTIAVVLGLGLFISLARPALARRTAMVVQAFATFGAVAGLTTVWLAGGPRIAPDVALHGLMLITLITGFVVAMRSR